MGWYTTAICEIDFCKETYNYVEEVESDIKDCRDYITSLEKKIILYTMSNPESIVKLDNFESLTEACDQVQSMLNEIKDTEYRITKLELLKEHFGLRGGDFVNNPDLKKNFKEFVKEEVLPEINFQKDKKNDSWL